MKVLALLQNMWVRDPEKVKRQIARDQTGKLRARMIYYALFAGCFTGRRLKTALGEAWCEKIIWEEASPVIAGEPKTYYPPDPEHIKSVLEKYQPEVIVCFTKRGFRIIRELVPLSIPVIDAPHPAARGHMVSEDLIQVKVLLDVYEHHFKTTGQVCFA